jgi:biotin operon repressor
MVASAVILGVFLSRYAKLVQEADKSTRLARDVWESMNTRFNVVDARIIDLMAKLEVLSSRSVVTQPNAQVHITPLVRDSVAPQPPRAEEEKAVSSPIASLVGGRTETERRVLQMLSEGPKSSAQIKDTLGRSREHTARLMKGLFDRGLVVRNDRNKPYVYEITESGRSYVVR